MADKVLSKDLRDTIFACLSSIGENLGTVHPANVILFRTRLPVLQERLCRWLKNT